MVKVVADTNIYISALFWLDELERILLTDGKFEMPREDVALYSEIILSHAEFVSPAFTLNVIVKDPADDRINLAPAPACYLTEALQEMMP